MPVKGKGKYAYLGLGPMCVKDKNGKNTHPVRLYRIWQDMLSRGRKDPSKIKSDPTYADLDTSVCKEWLKFNNFWRWSMAHGYRDDLTIDRIDNFKSYNPENCRWSTYSEQNKNRRMTPKMLAANRRNSAKGGAANAEKWRLIRANRSR